MSRACRTCGLPLRSGWVHCEACGSTVSEAEAQTSDSSTVSGLATSNKPQMASRGSPALTTWQFAQRMAAAPAETAPERWECVFKVLDGFRWYVLNPVHYRHTGTPTLVIPYFGTFRLLDRPAKRGVVPFSERRFSVPAGYRLRFRLSPQAKVSHFDSHSTEWIDKTTCSRNGSLSVQRRIAVAVSDQMDAELGLVDAVLTALYRHVVNMLTRKGQAFTYYKLGKFLPVTGKGSFKASKHARKALAVARAINA